MEKDYKITLTLVREAGSLMKLYCDEEKQLKAWSILYNIATVVGDVNMIVSGKACLSLLNYSTEKTLSFMYCIFNKTPKSLM